MTESNADNWIAIAALVLNGVLVPGLVQLTRYLARRFQNHDEKLETMQSQVKSLRRDVNRNLAEAASELAVTADKLKSLDSLLRAHLEAK